MLSSLITHLHIPDRLLSWPESHEEVLDISDRLGGLADGGEGEGGPVEAVEVLGYQTGAPAVHPAVAPEPDGETHRKVETGVVMDDNQNINDNFCYSEGIWITCSGFCFIEKFEHSIDAQYTIDSNNH